MAPQIPKREEPGGIVSGETVEEWAVPLVGAGCAGLGAYEIAEEAPEIAAIMTALGTVAFLKMR